MKYIKYFENYNITDKLAYIREEFRHFSIYIWNEELNKEEFYDSFETYNEAEKTTISKGFKLVKHDDFKKYYNEIKSKLLLAPNGRKSNLTPELYYIVRSKEFINWFGDWINNPDFASKVLDKNGEPLIVYHGTSQDFHKFDRSKISSRSGLNDRYFCFTTNIKMAKIYAKEYNEGGFIKPFFLNIKNMPEYDNKGRLYNELEVWAGYKWARIYQLQEFHERGYSHGDDRIKHGDPNYGKVSISFDKTDGFLVKNTIEMESGIPPEYTKYDLIGDTYYVYNSNQIKLADGSNIIFSNDDDVRENINYKIS